MNSHELAEQLLALPNCIVINSDDAEIDSVELDGNEIVLYSEDDEEDTGEITEIGVEEEA